MLINQNYISFPIFFKHWQIMINYAFNQEHANVKMALGGLTAHKIFLLRLMSFRLTLTVVGCVIHPTARTLSWKATCFFMVMDFCVK